MNDRCCVNCTFAFAVRNAAPGTLVCTSRPEAQGEPTMIAPCDCCPAFEPRSAPPVRPDPTEPPDRKTALIPLTQNKVATVDRRDFEWLSRHKWHVKKLGGKFYACRTEKGRTILMHREIMKAPQGMVVDHKRDNTLNNRRRNLRICTQAQNRANSKPHGGRSGFKGVYPQGDKWYGLVERSGKQHYAGSFPTPEEAARSRDRLAVKLFGEYAWLNFPEEAHIVSFSGTVRVRVTITATVTVVRKK
ncbi:MAG TPA: HNH endonuclease [Sedimentisphaerales bacterium]|nr:HNH endonuclease [Sedimentisphaerales bacterium]